MKSDKLPILAEIWLRNGEKIATIGFYDNFDNKIPSEICEYLVQKAEENIRTHDISMMDFGTLMVRLSDISAIKFTPFEY